MTQHIFLGIVAILFLHFLRVRYSRGLNRFDGPFLASLTDFWKVWYAYHNSQKSNNIYVDIHQKYGDIVRIGPNSLSFVDPRAVHDIYGTKGASQKSAMYEVTAVPTKGAKGVTLLASTDTKWHDQQRRLIAPAFTLSWILKYEPWVDETIRVFLDQIDERFEGKRGPQGVIDLHKWNAFFTADVISTLTYGQRTGFLETGVDIDGIHAGVRMVFRPWLYLTRMPLLDKLTFKNPILMWLQRRGMLEFPNPLLATINRHFNERKQIWERNKGIPQDRETLVDRFLTAEQEKPEKIELKPYRHAFTMIVAGSETTAITLTSIIYFLLKHPRCYRKLQQEIDTLSSDRPDQDPSWETISWSTAQTLPYLDACIHEAMRLHPVQRMPHERIIPPEGLSICGHHIPAGTDVGVYGAVLQRRADVFGQDVDEYRLERWLADEQTKQRMKNSMFTFSHGKFNCLGQNISRMEMYKFLPTIMRRYRISLVDQNSEWTILPGAFAIPSEVYVCMDGR